MDQFGITWVVYPGDPADHIVKLFSKLDYIVLPRETLLSGVVHRIAATPHWEEFNPADITAEVAEVVKRTTRLYDITSRLTEGESDISGSIPTTKGSI